MEMSYYFSGTIYNFLFSGVNVVTTWGMVSLCMGLACLSLLAEGFKVARSLLLKVATASHGTPCNSNTSERLPLLPSAPTECEMHTLLYCRRVKYHILQTFLHIIHLTIGYLLMLAVMTYNAYLTIAVVVGAGLGYYCFALFDLPSKVLGTIKSRPAKWSAGTPYLSEGNSSLYCPSCGTPGNLLSHSDPNVSSQLPQGSLTMYGTAFCETSVQEGGRTQMGGNFEGGNPSPNLVMCGDEEEEGLRGASVVVDVSDRACLLPQETVKVEVQVHALPEE